MINLTPAAAKQIATLHSLASKLLSSNSTTLRHYEHCLTAAQEMTKFKRPLTSKLNATLVDNTTPPGPDEKKLIFIRSCEASHNTFSSKWEADKKAGDALHDPECPIDPTLTLKGVDQAFDLMPYTRKMIWKEVPPQLIIVSPLRRAIQTGLNAFPFVAPGSNAGSDIPWIANNLVTESNGEKSDQLSHSSVLRDEYPGIDFDEYEKYVDVDLVNSIRSSSPIEAKIRLIQRADTFVSYLKQREEKIIVINSHSRFLQTFLGFALNVEPVEEGLKAFELGEMKCFNVKFTQ